MIKKLIALNVIDKDILANKVTSLKGKSITGNDMVVILEKSYCEVRYPSPYPIHKQYHLRGSIYWDPIRSSEPMDFAYKVGRIIIEKIDQDFNVMITREKISTRICDRDWERFCNLFFEAENLN